eukprot:432858-Amphidinium_carterae.1
MFPGIQECVTGNGGVGSATMSRDFGDYPQIGLEKQKPFGYDLHVLPPAFSCTLYWEGTFTSRVAFRQPLERPTVLACKLLREAYIRPAVSGKRPTIDNLERDV